MTNEGAIKVKMFRVIKELREIFKSETAAHDQLHQLTLQLEKTGKLQPTDFDTLKRTELEQRQIGFRLTNPVDSVEAKANTLANEFQQNKIWNNNIDCLLLELGIHLPEKYLESHQLLI